MLIKKGLIDLFIFLTKGLKIINLTKKHPNFYLIFISNASR